MTILTIAICIENLLCASSLPVLSHLILTTTLSDRVVLRFFCTYFAHKKTKFRKIKQNVWSHTAYWWQSYNSNSKSAWFRGPGLTAVLYCLTWTETKEAMVPKGSYHPKTVLSPFPPLLSKPQISWLTSKRFCRVGISTAVKSAKDLNCALVWSLRKVSTGMTPSGWIQISNSLKQDTCRHGTGEEKEQSYRESS